MNRAPRSFDRYSGPCHSSMGSREISPRDGAHDEIAFERETRVLDRLRGHEERGHRSLVVHHTVAVDVLAVARYPSRVVQRVVRVARGQPPSSDLSRVYETGSVRILVGDQ